MFPGAITIVKGTDVLERGGCIWISMVPHPQRIINLAIDGEAVTLKDGVVKDPGVVAGFWVGAGEDFGDGWDEVAGVGDEDASAWGKGELN